MVDYILLEEYAQNKSVLIVEDDENILKETKEFLELIFPNIDTAMNGEEGYKKYKEYKENTGKFYDIIITDIQMPIMNGIEFTRLVYKENKEQLLIVLSAHGEAHYLLELVNIGISHFITKPLNHDDFVHVLYTKLKEINHNTDSNDVSLSKTVQIDDTLMWDKESKQLYLDEKIVKLTKKEVLLLEVLLKYSEKTHTVEEIINILWADDENNSPDVNNLKNVISRLRKKVPNLDIENVYGFGYRINIK